MIFLIFKFYIFTHRTFILTGYIYKYNSKYSTRNINYYYRDIDKFPYSREAYDKIRQQDIKAHLSCIFALFEISYEQFERLDFETQYNLQHDLFKTISTILGRYFKVDALGNKEMYGLEQILIDLESCRETYYEHQYADTTLRERFSANPPDGYSRDDIKNMTQLIEHLEDSDDVQEIYHNWENCD